MERPTGRRRDQLRALLTRSPQENISGADPGNSNNPLATEQKEQAGRVERGRGDRGCGRSTGFVRVIWPAQGWNNLVQSTPTY